MKLNFNWDNDNKFHQYCIGCHAEAIKHIKIDGKSQYRCDSCHETYDRSIVIDPEVVWWVDEDKEYWHESSGVFIQDLSGKILLFERTAYPFSMTIPAGHVDTGETPIIAALREVQEEVGIKNLQLETIVEEDIWGDECRRGADVHRWHAYLATVSERPRVKLNDEGVSSRWLTIEEALASEIVLPVRRILERHRDSFKISDR